VSSVERLGNRAGVFCDCTAAPPWPEMQRLSVAGPNRYYLCRACGRVREEVCRADGTIVEVCFHKVVDGSLPPAAAEQARDLLTRPRYEQLSLFGD
jgi:hypothetical protein